MLFAAIDALVGSEIGDEEKAQVKAYLHNTDVDSAGAVTVSATNGTSRATDATMNSMLALPRSGIVLMDEVFRDSTSTARVVHRISALRFESAFC